MNKTVGFISGILAIVLAVALSIVLPIPTPQSRTVSLPVSRLMACPVGDANLGNTAVTITDMQPFTAELIGEPPEDETTHLVLENPAKPIIVRGSASVGGISSYTERGLTMMAPCAAPITTGSWNGVMTHDTQTALIFSNVDNTSAVVDVFLYSATGPITGPGLLDVPVGPGATQMLSINQLVENQMIPTDTPISVHIRTSKGRVAALLRSISPLGAQWQHPQAVADTTMVMAGIPSGAGNRILSITNTDQTRQATVAVDILGEMGRYSPPGLETIEIPPSRVVNLDITQALGAQAASIQLNSDLPISAAVAVIDKDIAGISAQPPLGGEVVIPPVGGILWVANPGAEPTTISLYAVDDTGAGAVIETPVPPLTMVRVDFPSKGHLVKISTTSKDLRTTIAITEGPSWAVFPITSGGVVSDVSVPRLDPGLG
ncbi:MAG: DUF5719 family protein [Propionibacteriaceae bacterium]|nr:DUF5719 family protein [Propionibacteriaceae bacterium]